MNKLLSALIVASAASAVPATAANFNFVMTGNSLIFGADGNARYFSASAGGETMNVRASGWSFDGATVRDSFLGAYGTGLGVTSGDDLLGLFNLHTIDNAGRADFILLQFDETVELVGVNVTTYSVLGGAKDSDMTIGYGTADPLAWNSQPAFDGQSGGLVAQAFAGSFASNGTGAGGYRALAAGHTGNMFLIAAALENPDSKIDGFKLKSIKVRPFAAPVVPEPASWAMMIAGFGLVGGALRRDGVGRRTAIA